jgi:hypothetical protein
MRKNREAHTNFPCKLSLQTVPANFPPETVPTNFPHKLPPQAHHISHLPKHIN